MTLEEEKAKARFEHRLAVRRLMLDKLVVGLIILGLGYFASIAVERYKAAEAGRQFLLEKRFEAVKEIRSGFSRVTGEFFSATAKLCSTIPVEEAQREKMKQEIGRLINSLNNSAVLFDQDYENGTHSIVNIFYAFSLSSFRLGCEHRHFGSELAGYFTNLNKIAIGVSDSLRSVQFIPIDIDAVELDRIGVEEYTKRNFERWKENAKVQ